MGKFDTTQDRALELIGEIGDGLRKRVPDKAMQWIETGAAMEALRAAACDEGQGYLFARPMTLAELEAFLAGAEERGWVASEA